ncbi:MAG: polymer-forming cytoskeletal protein [Oligoflexia bacterium]|nr:polymer-forming cytoskeletal protein [Oligoflexia bacterium]
MSFGKLREDAKEAEKIGGQPVLQTVPGGSTSASGRADAFLGKGTKVVGTLNFSGSAEIDCQVEGEINARELLTVSDAAVVNGKVLGTEIIVRGTVNGDIIASKRLTLKKPARVIGNISSPNLVIEEGVLFEGKCSMATGAASSSDTSKGATKSAVASA